MSSPNNCPIIVVLGAAGQQGGGVARALLKSGKWHVRAATRDPTSTKAKTLLEEAKEADGILELVKVHPYEIETLREAFVGACGVFAITSERHPDKKVTSEDEMTHEIEAGRNAVHAAQECGVQHFVFSSLPDMEKVTSGKYPKLYHMNNKYAVEKIAREKLQQVVTCLIPGFFYTNLHMVQYTRRDDDGRIRFCFPVPSDQYTQWSDGGFDMGAYAARVFELGPAHTGGKIYNPLSASITPRELAEIFTRVTGQDSYHEPTSMEEFGDLNAPMVGPPFREDAIQMMQWAAEAPKNLVAYESVPRPMDDLGLAATTFEDWLKRTGWRGPSK